jgi:hypothetical protein
VSDESDRDRPAGGEYVFSKAGVTESVPGIGVSPGLLLGSHGKASDPAGGDVGLEGWDLAELPTLAED